MPYVKRRRGYGKRRIKRRKMRRKRYRGRRKGKSVMYDVIKTGASNSTITKSAIRVASKTGTCNYVVLHQDPDKLVFDDGTKAPFSGDMSFYGPLDIGLGLNINQQRATDEVNARENDGYPTLFANPNMIDPTVSSGYMPVSTDYKSVIAGKMHLFIKSAITGSNVNMTLYKCKARYNIPKFAFSENTRPSSNIYNSNATWALQNIPTDSPAGLKQFMQVQNMHMLGWLQAMGANDSPAQGITFPANQIYPWHHQEGTTLFDNRVWCTFFKIVKQYKAELVPGQMAKLSLNMKKHLLNPVKASLSNQHLVLKGQVFFVLKLEGSIGHQSLTDVDPLNQINRFFPKNLSRPNIGIMPAAVDVMCIKKFMAWTKYKPTRKIKQIWRQQDYLDDDATETLSSQAFIDSAPSDYTASAAVIN